MSWAQGRKVPKYGPVHGHMLASHVGDNILYFINWSWERFGLHELCIYFAKCHAIVTYLLPIDGRRILCNTDYISLQ